MSQRPQRKYIGGDMGYTRPAPDNHPRGWENGHGKPYATKTSKKLLRWNRRKMRWHWPLSEHPKAGPYSKLASVSAGGPTTHPDGP